MKSQTATYVCELRDFDTTCLTCEHEFWRWEMPVLAQCPGCGANPYEPPPLDGEPDSD